MIQMHKKKLQFATLIAVSSFLLSGCESALSGRHIKLKEIDDNPIIVSTYDYQGQKVDNFKLKSADIMSDRKISNAIDIKYGQNKIIHANNPMIAYVNLTNFADQYDKNIANKKYVDAFGNKIMASSKDHPEAGEIYGMFKDQFPSDGTVMIVKSDSGSPIGIFAGHEVSVKDFGNDDKSTAEIILDGHKIFIYNTAYTMYPVSALKAMYKNRKATNTSHQAGIKTKSIMPNTDTASDKKHK